MNDYNHNYLFFIVCFMAFLGCSKGSAPSSSQMKEQSTKEDLIVKLISSVGSKSNVHYFLECFHDTDTSFLKALHESESSLIKLRELIRSKFDQEGLELFNETEVKGGVMFFEFPNNYEDNVNIEEDHFDKISETEYVYTNPISYAEYTVVYYKSAWFIKTEPMRKEDIDAAIIFYTKMANHYKRGIDLYSQNVVTLEDIPSLKKEMYK